MHTNAHAYARTHLCTHIHHTNTYMHHANTHMHHPNTHTHHTHTHTLAHTHARTHTHTYTHTHTHTHTHTCTHTPQAPQTAAALVHCTSHLLGQDNASVGQAVHQVRQYPSPSLTPILPESLRMRLLVW